MFAPFRSWWDIDNDSFSVSDEKFSNTGMQYFNKDIWKYTMRIQKARTWTPENQIKNIIKVESMIFRDSAFIVPSISQIDSNWITFTTPVLDTDTWYVTIFFTKKWDNDNKMAKYIYTAIALGIVAWIMSYSPEIMQLAFK